MTLQVTNPQTSCADPEPSSTLRVAAAREAIQSGIKPILTTERLALRDALGRVLAEPIVSPLDVPGHTNSAMDGYALKGSDLQSSTITSYKLIGTTVAGQPFQGQCQSGECIRIMTGAPMPEGTDTVIMQEQARLDESQMVSFTSQHKQGQNVRHAGEDIAKGSSVLEPGRRLTAADLGVMASLGFGEVSVRRRPRVAFFSTGDELRGIGETLREGDVYDSNRYSLYGMLKNCGVDLLDMGVIRDDPEALRQAFQAAAEEADMVISSGGVSVGEADYTKKILQQLGEIHFWKIAMKPGRPLAFGELGETRFFGLPGNPVAVMVTFYQFVLPAIHYLATGKPYQPFTLRAVCQDALRKRPGRYEFIRGVFSSADDGQLKVESVGQQGSGILTSMSRGNCFILLPESCAGVTEGDQVEIQPFASLSLE
ncbi:MAG: bifunctional molybdopterin-guanine dinucleotide biosynthesis adaptor protein MobB/molybdopterin molybdotransferase MoeA [Candidatus Thiodiazotropha taylori]|nr:bifunctional molybdopterin-guanine dinucleotide biosynthesis adaptor protein MobB/molybdopterin molybdotransferase MoeA [Candidatus Thiodiazotropha taylori]MCG7934929.1 bifunctional molybdopterin-guanine dinucleotide biosynthesis adaptor protein MobB/molybdopterin molybdotransferase MoeA [Candidatus Thiodiazotropha taylori]MCG7970416.1 bifunctional molybdopterin-guanine dinucleotide biosynthesis adaptor protein MobB/molybdopterin molybdotransferase MoeA [Candidatus Thiodiazotropha taylori]